jgi:hypothetical protein
MNALIPVLRTFRGLIISAAWHELPGVPDSFVPFHTWQDESVDTLTVHSETRAFAQRTNPAGTPVWKHIGSLLEVVEALRQVLPPSDPDAPREPQDTPSRDRDLGAS